MHFGYIYLDTKFDPLVKKIEGQINKYFHGIFSEVADDIEGEVLLSLDFGHPSLRSGMSQGTL